VQFYVVEGNVIQKLRAKKAEIYTVTADVTDSSCCKSSAFLCQVLFINVTYFMRCDSLAKVESVLRFCGF